MFICTFGHMRSGVGSGPGGRAGGGSKRCLRQAGQAGRVYMFRWTYGHMRSGVGLAAGAGQAAGFQSTNARGNPSTMRVVSTLTCTRRLRWATSSAGSSANQALGSLTMPLSLSWRCAAGPLPTPAACVR